MAIEKRDLTWLGSTEGPSTEVFICGASYEDRCLSIASSINQKRLRHALIGVNQNLLSHVGKNAAELRNIFGTSYIVVEMDSTNPIKTADAWIETFKNYISDEIHEYLFDITTFTHESLLVVLKLLSIYAKPRDNILFVYTSAKDYDPPRQGKDKWLSKGVAEVRSILGYPGVILPSKKTHLIVLVGFEHERATRLIQAFEPNRVSLRCGGQGSATSEKHDASNARFHQLVSEMAARYAPVEKFEFACNNPWETRDSILEQARRYPEYNIVVAPMNTKISTVGCALAAWVDESIQLCYAQAIRYNYAHYSIPAESCYYFKLPEIISHESSAESLNSRKIDA